MQSDAEGFLYPEINIEQCIHCGLCKKICPVINQGQERKPLHVYAAKNKNEEIRRKSSSGGIFTLLAEQIIRNGGVVFGARFNDAWEVIHDYTETIEGLAAFRGSKYVQSSIGNTYRQAKEFLEEGRDVLFSGTPCQIAGLKAFLQRDYEKLLTVDLVCHGVPSPAVWGKYLDEIVKKPSTPHHHARIAIAAINFRDKTYGWKVFSLSLQFINENKKIVSLIEPLDKNIFMKGFLNDLYLRPSCHQCPSKSLKSGSDITLGDYWGIKNILPEFDDDKGTSLVIINTHQGKNVFSTLKVATVETSYTDALSGNSLLVNSISCPRRRKKFMKHLAKKPIIQLINDVTNFNVI
jgi:coenzyme F420-reducing hydrogenase beta subunit